MKRTDARELAMRLCFELMWTDTTADQLLAEKLDMDYYTSLAPEDEIFSEYPDETQLEYIRHLLKGIETHYTELDGYIEKYAKGRKFERISKTALAILKTAMYEVLYMPEIPDSAAINEAVEIAKKYEEPETVPFINGVLGSFVRGEKS